MSDSITKWYETSTGNVDPMSDREIMNAKSGLFDNLVYDEPTVNYGRKASEILKEEYPTIYAGYMAVMEELI